MMVPPIPPATLAAQARASDPRLSAWVSANAGSGKTHVLAQRVIRLLLQGVPPAKILCLTFTKAAAANMALRVFDTLARWTSLDDPALSAAIVGMTGAVPGPIDLLTARCLFARTVETPGGLKIQTIHAFCERLLHLFPFEANVAAGFEVMDDNPRQAALLETARAAVFEAATSGERADLAEALDVLADEATDISFDTLVGEIIARRAHVRAIDRHYRRGEYEAALSRRLGVPPGADAASIERAMVEDGLAPAEWAAIARKLDGSEPKPDSTAGRLIAAATAAGVERRGAAYLQVFLKKDLDPRADSYLTKTQRKAHPDLCEAMDRERARLLALVAERRAALAVRRTSALLAVGEAIVADYARQKALRGLLDYDDLTSKTLSLLTRSDAAWVHYKLDEGVDHVLIDEAQDTSPQQWGIIESLTAEFSAGDGAHPRRRTIFAVGDEKQSIFSFQGAAPKMFEEMRARFTRKIAAASPGGEVRFAHVPLHLSFRSVPAVLEAVDDVFADPAHFQGLSFDAAQTKTVHESWKSKLPGGVEIWETVAASETPEPADWRLPVDARAESAPPVRLALRIAQAVKTWTAPGSPDRVHDAHGRRRPVRPGDILILVQVRNQFFHAMTRALKEAGVAVAGPDRIGLNSHIAVMDLIAAARAALLRGDDLALACVLKSPLIGLDDDDLIGLAPERTGSLADALDAAPCYAAAAARLRGWRLSARTSTPFAFFMRLLASEGGRERLLARLGREADDAIDEFLRLALDHERDGAPSLSRFLDMAQATDIEVKRDMEAAGDRVRVMTVHAAKGLEAKIVVLADTCAVPNGRKLSRLSVVEPEAAPIGTPDFLVWSARAADDPEAVREARAKKLGEAFDEYRRLLYVAMTRAEEKLVVAGFEGKPRKDGSASRPERAWYGMIRSALEPGLSPMPAPWSADETIFWRGTIAAADSPPHAAAADARPPALPAWLRDPAPIEMAPPPPLRPSNALHAADDPPQATAWTPRPGARRDARAVGRCLHALLQHLPGVAPERRRSAAARYLAAQAPAVPLDQRPGIIETALGVIEAPDLAILFAPEALAEVRIAGRLERADGTGVTVSGQIDRMGVGDDEIVIAEFKTGFVSRDSARQFAYAAQIAIYQALVRRLYPGKRVRALLILTAVAETVELDDNLLGTALRAVLA